MVRLAHGGGLREAKRERFQTFLVLEIDEGQRNYSILGGISQAIYNRLIIRI